MNYWTNDELLKISLSVAVPLWIERMRSLPEEERLAIAHECGQVIAEKGDIIQYRSKKKYGTVKAFNALAKGLAALAFAPGGVTFCGMHFEA